MSVPLQLACIFDELDPSVRKRKISNYEVLKLLCMVLQTGIPWRYLPVNGICEWSTVYKRYQRWIKDGLFDKALQRLQIMYSTKKLAEDPLWFKNIFIDCSFVKNVGGVDCLGKNPTDRGRLATKMSAIIDNDQMPLSCEFFPGNMADCNIALQTALAIKCPLRLNKRYINVIVADKGYVSQGLMRDLANVGMGLLTPSKLRMRRRLPMSKNQKASLKCRHKVENFFCRLDKFKKIYCRHEKSIKAYRALTALAMAILLARHPILSTPETPTGCQETPLKPVMLS